MLELEVEEAIIVVLGPGKNGRHGVWYPAFPTGRSAEGLKGSITISITLFVQNRVVPKSKMYLCIPKASLELTADGWRVRPEGKFWIATQQELEEEGVSSPTTRKPATSNPKQEARSCAT